MIKILLPYEFTRAYTIYSINNAVDRMKFAYVYNYGYQTIQRWNGGGCLLEETKFGEVRQY